MTAVSDPFAKWRSKESLPQQQSTDISEQDQISTPILEQKKIMQTSQMDPFSKWKEKIPEEEKSFREEIPRHAARTGSRIIETIAGMPGDIANFLKFIVGKVPGPEKFKQVLKGIPGGYLGSIPQTTSSQLKEVSEEITGGLTKPKSKEEERADEIVQDLTALMIPIKGKIPNITKVIGTEVAAQLGKEGVKMLGGSENAQNLTKAATLFTGGLIRPKNALDYAESLYNKADSLLPPGARVNANKLENSLNSLVTSLEKGVETTDKKQVIKPAKELLSKIEKGNINVDELVAAKRDINKLRGDPETVKGAKKLLSNIGKQVDIAIELYGSKNPKFLKTFKNANEAWGTLAQSKKVSNSINSILKLTPLKSGIGLLFETAALGKETAILTAAGAGAIYGTLKSSELLYRIMKSPVLRTYYSNVVKAALQENGPAISTALKKLDSAMIQEDQRQSKSSSLSRER